MTNRLDGRMLIVDDDQDVLEGLADMLEGEGLLVRICPDAFSALEFVEYEKFDVVLSDVRMPAVSGLELLEHVQRIDPDIPVIMMTGHADVDTAIAAVKHRAFDFLQKPLEPEILISVLARALNFRRLREVKREYSGLLKCTVDKNTDELRQQIEELRIARDAAMESSRLKSEFMANMTHEIRTPLHGIVGLLDLLRHQEHTSNQAKCFDMMQKSIDRLSSLVSNVLDFSRMASGAFELNPRQFSLNDMIGLLIRKYEPKAKAKGLSLSVEVGAELPDTLFADDARLGQVIGTLLDNAVKFTQTGAVNLNLLSKGISCPDRHTLSLFCSVSDTGIGIPAEKMETIFDGFSQADGSFTRKHDGAGLGLAIAKHTVQSMGGTLQAESSPGIGSTFFFIVPVGEKEAQ